MHRCWRRCWPVAPDGSTNSPAPSPPPHRRAWRRWAPGSHRASTASWAFTVKLPDTDRVLNHISWRDDPPATQWQPVPTWFERLRRAGVGARAVLPAAFVGSGLTEAAYRGAQFVAAKTDDDYAQLVVDQLRAAPGLVYAYTAALDTAAHVFGIGSAEWHAAGAYVDALLTRLVEALPPDAALLITADHGGLNVPRHRRIDLDADSRLSAGSASGRRRSTGALPAHRAGRGFRRDRRLERTAGWAGRGAQPRRRRRGWAVRKRAYPITCRGSATSSSAVSVTRRCWRAPTSHRKWLSSSASMEPATRSRWRSR